MNETIDKRKVGVWLDYIGEFIRQSDSASALKYIEELQTEIRSGNEFRVY